MSAALNLELPNMETNIAVGQQDRLRVLICEDDKFTRRILTKRVEAGGYEVETAADGREGLEKIARFKPDLVLSDWMMPEIDGVELCSRIRELDGGENIYFILLTARDTNDDKVSALDTGADEYLVKPIDGRELMARLRAAERLLSMQHALASKNAQLAEAYDRINEELQATSLIQRSLLPQSLPELPGYRFAAHYQPSTECSGDFYDLLRVSDNRMGIVMGDVSGHGAPAMVAMALCHTLLHMECPRTQSANTLLSNVNTMMFSYLPTTQYATLFYATLEPLSGELQYSSAGHNPPIILRAKTGTAEYLKNCEGFPIKLVAPNLPYDLSSEILRPGDLLITYTDGLVEAFNSRNEQYGPERLLEVASRLRVKDPADALSVLLSDLGEWCQGRLMSDDLSLLIVRRDD